MFNTDYPDRADLPSSAKLIRSSIIAGVSAVGILITVVLPSEYGIDVTGFGRLTGLTTMGEIKMQLAAEAAAADALSAQVAAGTPPATPPAPAAKGPTSSEMTALAARVGALERLLQSAQESPPATAPLLAPEPLAAPAEPDVAAPEPAPTAPAWQHEVSFTLTPMQGTEYKLVMEAGAVAEYEFVVEGGVINFDAHGEGGGQSVTFEQVRGVSEDNGTLQAPFAGTHGWFFRNRGDADVTVTLRTRGQYSEMRKLA